MKSKSLVDFPYNYQFDIGERVMFHGEKFTVTNVTSCNKSEDQKLWLEFDDGDGVIIWKDDDWNTQDEVLLKLIIRGGEIDL